MRVLGNSELNKDQHGEFLSIRCELLFKTVRCSWEFEGHWLKNKTQIKQGF
jgi:hypothetical protein